MIDPVIWRLFYQAYKVLSAVSNCPTDKECRHNNKKQHDPLPQFKAQDLEFGEQARQLVPVLTISEVFIESGYLGHGMVGEFPDRVVLIIRAPL